MPTLSPPGRPRRQIERTGEIYRAQLNVCQRSGIVAGWTLTSFRSRPRCDYPEFRSMDVVKIPYQFLTSLWHTTWERHLFDDVKTYVLFIGYPRSGHSL